jgi:hypothetical protein
MELLGSAFDYLPNANVDATADKKTQPKQKDV